MPAPTVLVTGGAGFIGSAIVRRALSGGYAVRVLDDLSSGRRQNLAGLEEVTFIEGSILDADALEHAINGCDGVFHLAGQVSVARSIEEPEFTHAVNATGTMRVLQAASRHRVNRVVYSSTCAGYGREALLPNREDAVLAPDSPYGASKVVGELYASAWTTSMGLEVVSLRYFNVFGPRQNPSGGYPAVIPIFIKRLLHSEPISIYGDGEQTRDFVYVDDVAEANFAAFTAPNAAGRVFNIGTGRRVTVNHLLEVLQRLVATETQPTHQPGRVGEIRHSVASIERAQNDLGFQVTVDLEEGLRRTVAWHKQQGAA